MFASAELSSSFASANMATANPNVQIIGMRIGVMTPPATMSVFSLKPKERRRNFAVRCALFQQDYRQSRRLISIALLCLHGISMPKDAFGGGVFDKYVKRKKLDPLVTYIPAVILTEMQIKELGKSLEVKQPQYADCRSLLRSGPAGSLRVNIRAVAQYASDASNSKSAFDNVDDCLRSLEELDSLLLRASRNESDAPVDTMMVKVGAALSALDSLLKTVPSEVLEKGKAIANAYLNPDYNDTLDNPDPEIQNLESIL